MPDHLQKLKQFLANRGRTGEVRALTADASTREYFRIRWDGVTAVACVYPEPFDPAEQTYLDVTKLFLAGGLPVAKVLDLDVGLGIVIQEDLGDLIFRDVMLKADDDSRESLLDEAISLIARIQTTTGKAFEMNSVASKLKFDREKLLWELDYFKTHYFETYLKQLLSTEDDVGMSAEFRELAEELESFATVLCHRDFHSANLMIDPSGKIRIIDHQDARIGSSAYDLVSLLLDRITEMPSADWLAGKRRFFLDQCKKLGLAEIDEADFAYEFRLQTIQRCLKAAGTFSFQSATRGKKHFVPFIKPIFEAALLAAENLNRFPVTQRILRSEIG